MPPGAGYGYTPAVRIYFRLKPGPGLGLFQFHSDPWALAGKMDEDGMVLSAFGGPAWANSLS